MENINSEKIKIILLGVIALILLCLLIVISFRFKEDNGVKNQIGNSDKNSNVTEKFEENDTDSNSNVNQDSNNKNDKIEDDSSTNSDTSKLEEVIKPSSTPGVDTSNNDNTVSNQESSSKQENVSYQEGDVVVYFENLENDITTYQRTNDTSLKDKIKNGFITVVDFLFYDSTIKGYTFDELTSEAKLKVLTLALKIDNKIDKYFPNYKETIKNKTTAFKEKVALSYLETTAKLCEGVGEDSCRLARENFKDMKESFGFTWENIKNIASYSKDKLATILKEWYQSIKD